jgi:hypothetical protein
MVELLKAADLEKGEVNGVHLSTWLPVWMPLTAVSSHD